MTKNFYEQGRNDCRTGISRFDGKYILPKEVGSDFPSYTVLAEWERGWRDEWAILKEELDARFPPETKEQTEKRIEQTLEDVQFIRKKRAEGLSDDEIEELLGW